MSSPVRMRAIRYKDIVQFSLCIFIVDLQTHCLFTTCPDAVQRWQSTDIRRCCRFTHSLMTSCACQNSLYFASISESLLHQIVLSLKGYRQFQVRFYFSPRVCTCWYLLRNKLSSHKIMPVLICWETGKVANFWSG